MCEVFFLTHSEGLHNVNLSWNPKGEEFLWSPATQVPKKTAPDTVVYDYGMRRRALERFTNGLNKYLCPAVPSDIRFSGHNALIRKPLW